MSATSAATTTAKAPPATAGKIPKPEMRRLFYNRSKWAIVGATIFSASIVLTWKFTVTDVKKQKYAEFYANYDPEKEQRRLIAVGLHKWAPTLEEYDRMPK